MKTKGQLSLRVALHSAAVLAVSPAFSQTLDIGEILITPNRTETEASKTGSKVETVDREKIEQEGKSHVTDYLTLLPGVYVSPPGGTGQETSLSVRGADKKYVKTLFNGIDISDPTATQVQTSFEHLFTGNIGGIEVLKGSQSTLYGADAVAGVIGISTLKDVEDGVHHEVSTEAGSFGTVLGGYTVSGAGAFGRGSFGIQGIRTDGISAAESAAGNTEADGYDNISANFAGEHELGDAVTVFASGLIVRSNAEFDDSGNPPTDNPFNTTAAHQAGGRVGFDADLLDGRFRNTVSAQVFNIDRDLHAVSGFGPFDANYKGMRLKADYQGAFDATEWLTLQFGADHEQQTADVTDNYGTDTSDEMSIAGVWMQTNFEPTENLTLTAGARHDEHSNFGGYNTWRVTGAYSFDATGTKLHASAGTGFRAPSLYELYAPFGTGNPNLDPEQSRSFDIGVEQTWLDGDLVADVTYFRLDTENLIDYSFSTGSYEQVAGTTERQGVEASFAWKAFYWLDIAGAYTYTHTRQPDGARRPRIPAHEATLSAVIRPKEKWEVVTTAHAVFNVTDRISPSSGTFVDVSLDDYVLFDAKVAYKPTEDLEFYLRGENLFNQQYQVVKGYGTPGIAAYAGMKARF